MSVRTLFFREEYSIKEMYDRIYAEDFITIFNKYAIGTDSDEESLEVNKSNCLLGLSNVYRDDPDQLYFEVLKAFEQHGRKGDKLNVKLFKLVPFEYGMTELLSNRLTQLKDSNTNIRNVDDLATAFKHDIYLADFKQNDISIDFKFRIDTTFIVHTPTPVKENKDVYIEARLYLYNGIVAVSNIEGTPAQTKNVLSIIHLLFQRHSPQNQSVNFDESQLIMIQLRLNGEVSAPRFRTDDDLRVDIYNINHINYENPLVRMVQGQESLRIYALSSWCVLEGNRFRLNITEEGRIQVETFVTPQILDAIIHDINWVILSDKYYKDISKQIVEVNKAKNPAGLSAHRQQKVNQIQNELRILVENNKSKNMQSKEVKLVGTIILNIAHLLAENGLVDEISEDILAQYDFTGYQHLNAYISDFIVYKLRKKKNYGDAHALRINQYLQYFISASTGDAVQLIEFYQNTTRRG